MRSPQHDGHLGRLDRIIIPLGRLGRSQLPNSRAGLASLANVGWIIKSFQSNVQMLWKLRLWREVLLDKY